MTGILNEVRRAMERSKTTRYALSKATGIDQAQLCRVLDGTAGLSVERLERLAGALGFEVVLRPRRRRKG